MPQLISEQYELYLDRVDDLSMVERYGAIQSLVRKARVIFRTPPGGYIALTEALKVCPNAYSLLTDKGYESLVLVGREPRVVENDPNVIDVLLKYELITEGANQSLGPPAPGKQTTNQFPGYIFGKGKCSIVEKTTNFYRLNGDPSQPQIAILVGHTVQPQEQAPVGISAYPGLPNLIIQGGEVTIPFPSSNFQVQGVRKTIDPQSDAESIVACINDDYWLGHAAAYWLCTEAQWEVLDVVEGLYKFTFEFQYNNDTWLPTVVFTDQRTGRPPAGVEQATLVDNNGTLRFTVYPYSPGAAIAAFGAGFAGFLQALSIAQAAPTAFTIPDAPLPFLKDYLAKNPDGSYVSLTPGTVVPAGIWQVPALRPANFGAYFGGFGVR